jgi:hypothetical protein
MNTAAIPLRALSALPTLPALPVLRAPPFARPEMVRDTQAEAADQVLRPLSLFETLYGQTWLRKTVILLVLAALWEVYGRWLNNPLLFPSFSQTVQALAPALAAACCCSVRRHPCKLC